MATVEIEIGENGEIGTLPEPIQKFFDKRLNEQYQKGADKAEARFKGLIVDPKEIERLRTIEKEAEDTKIALLERDKNYEEAQKIRDKRHQDELAKERELHGKTKTRIREFAHKSIRAAAVEAGARVESLDELERLIGAEVDFDDDMQIFVKGADGQPLADDKGARVSVEGYVAAYLEKKPHHKAATPVKGGKAPGGAAFRGQPQTPTTEKDKARLRMQEEATPQNTNAFIDQIVSGLGR